MELKKKTVIEYNNKNSQWNKGYVNVYVKGVLQELIGVDDFLENNTDEDVYCVDDIIDQMKVKYSISKVVRNELNWK